MFLGLMGLGAQELVVIVIIIMILFGGKRLGDIGKGLGEGIRNFRSAVKDEKPDADKSVKPSA
jgi:sec-independent protein translocase protein TatA